MQLIIKTLRQDFEIYCETVWNYSSSDYINKSELIETEIIDRTTKWIFCFVTRAEGRKSNTNH